MRTQATTQEDGTDGRARSAALLTLALGALLAAIMALVAGTAREAEATFPGQNARIAFASERTTGTGVDNPTGDREIFTIKPDGTGLKQLTHNTGDDELPVFSPDGTKIAYESREIQNSNPEGDFEVYLMNALDGSGEKNLSNNGSGVQEFYPVFSPGGGKIAYQSSGKQTSNPQGDYEVYAMNALDGTAKKNLSNNGLGIHDEVPVYSPGGKRIAYDSEGIQTSNSQGDIEVYTMSATDGTAKKNLTNNGGTADDYYPLYSPDGKKVAYQSSGKQTSNPEGDKEVYSMNALDGSSKKNLSNNGANDYDPDWGRRAM